MPTLEIDTPFGGARAHVDAAADARAALVLGHGAGGGVNAPDLTEAAGVARSLGMTVVLVEQPYRVAGRRSPAPAHQLDAAWSAVIEHLLAGELRGQALVAGGRSSGARVACRTAPATGAIGVLCLAFPLLPPRRSGSALVVQGKRDPFGIPPAGELRTVALVEADHSLRTDLVAMREAVRAWLDSLLG